jgi:TolB-like protein/Flp pilus assembly protein TadD
MSGTLATDRLRLRLFGPLQILRGDVSLPTPASRKTRAVLGYLVLTQRPVSRQRLCELFFEMPDDPRAALRWSLTKLRPLVDTLDRVRLIADRDWLRLDLSDVDLDVAHLMAAAEGSPDAVSDGERSRALDLVVGDLLEDAELPDRPEYAAWLAAQRQDFRTLALGLARQQAEHTSGPDRIRHLHRLVAMDPLDESASGSLAAALVQAGRRDEAHRVVAQVERHMRSAGLQPGPILRMSLRDSVARPRVVETTGPEPPSRASVEDGRISVGVIPFLNHSPDVLRDELMDGLTEATVHMMSRFRDIRVAGLSAVLAFKGAIQDPKTMGDTLGVTHLAGGSVMVREGLLRIRYRLVAAHDGALVASGDIDHPYTDAFALLEDAPSRLVVLLAHHLSEIARQTAIETRPSDRTAWAHFLSGVQKSFFDVPVDHLAALADYEAGLRLVPDDPSLNAYAVWAKAGLGQGLVEPQRRLALAQAHRAISSADDNADALAIAAWSAVHIGHDFDAGLRAIELATRLNPLSRIAWSASAWIRTMAGETEAPLIHWDHADRCNPLGSGIDHSDHGRALCHWMAGRLTEAMEAASRGIVRQPTHPVAHMVAVAAAVEQGRGELIDASVKAMLRYFPDAPDSPIMASMPIRSAETKARLLEALRSARAPLDGGSAAALAHSPVKAGGRDREGAQPDPRTAFPAASASAVEEGGDQEWSTPVPVEDRPCIAVLPFQDLSAEALPGHIPAGFLDGLTHALSRFRSIVVISAASTAAYAGRLEDPVATARSLGADILVVGSLMAASDGRLRLRWRAVDGQAGRTLALGDTEGRLAELWDFQETAATAIAVEVEPRAQIEALRIRQALPTTSPDAYNLYLEGLFAGFSVDGRDYDKALALFEQALGLDPKFHPALAMAPWAAAYGNRIQSPADLERFAQMSRDALLHGRDDARTQATAGTALFYMAHDFKAAHRSIDRAIALNPNEYTAWICGGWMRAMKNEAEAAHEMFDRAERLNPLAYGANGLMSGRAMAEFMAGRLENAEHYVELALAGDDSHPSALMTGIATAAGLGKRESCRARCAVFLSIYPDGLENFAIRALPFEEPVCRDRYFTAVAAGMEASDRA